MNQKNFFKYIILSATELNMNMSKCKFLDHLDSHQPETPPLLFVDIRNYIFLDYQYVANMNMNILSRSS